jgi:DNA-directed RNA polymerase sigma subunit (sigma70/sigma32)
MYDMVAVIREAQARRKRALRMRKKKMTLQQIGDEFGVTRQRACEIVKRAEQEARRGR